MCTPERTAHYAQQRGQFPPPARPLSDRPGLGEGSQPIVIVLGQVGGLC